MHALGWIIKLPIYIMSPSLCLSLSHLLWHETYMGPFKVVCIGLLHICRGHRRAQKPFLGVALRQCVGGHARAHTGTPHRYQGTHVA